ncbi:carboxymuconolactone decarboxylase family protein [Novosphingobium sp. BL-52-GroH]|uniref:carboxymuconolactone decarboxylase family protein n=1 Tax=Novosphingobium sp. BL-52-GroH TaxID=3349877 RepID=UPI00384E4C04
MSVDDADEHGRRLILHARDNGAPDERIVAIYAQSKVGRAFFDLWNLAMGPTDLPLRLKELVRLQMSVSHECGYCTSVRSKAAAAEGVTEELIAEMLDFEHSDHFSDAERCALWFAKLYKFHPDRLRDDAVWDALHAQFSDAQIVELGVLLTLMNGGSDFAKSLDLVSWSEVCELNPHLARVMKRIAVREAATGT